MHHTMKPFTAMARGRAAQRGLSMVELMIALALGLIVLAALVSVFANSSASRQEMERTSRQIENGRYAMQLLSDDIRLAGFYGEANVKAIPLPGVLPDPCSTTAADWGAAMPLHLMGYDNGAGIPTCVPGTGTLKPATDVIAIRRVATCEAGVGTCPAITGGRGYIQVAKCSTQTPITPYEIGIEGSATFDRQNRDCATAAGKREYMMRAYFISSDNGRGDAIPTLMRIDFNGAGFTTTPLVEGIEELHFEYGIDTDNDGAPNAFTADPTNYICAGCTAITNWGNVVTVRINLLARNLEESLNYTDTKRYTLGRDAAGNEITVAPGGAYRRHAYTSVVRVVNAAERRDTPL
jgi:type IV pilus assembly protein PilW